MRLAPIIERRKLANEWEIDAFAGGHSDRVDTREVEEAIGMALTTW